MSGAPPPYQFSARGAGLEYDPEEPSLSSDKAKPRMPRLGVDAFPDNEQFVSEYDPESVLPQPRAAEGGYYEGMRLDKAQWWLSDELQRYQDSPDAEAIYESLEGYVMSDAELYARALKGVRDAAKTLRVRLEPVKVRRYALRRAVELRLDELDAEREQSGMEAHYHSELARMAAAIEQSYALVEARHKAERELEAARAALEHQRALERLQAEHEALARRAEEARQRASSASENYGLRRKTEKERRQERLSELAPVASKYVDPAALPPPPQRAGPLTSMDWLVSPVFGGRRSDEAVERKRAQSAVQHFEYERRNGWREAQLQRSYRAKDEARRAEEKERRADEEESLYLAQEAAEVRAREEEEARQRARRAAARREQEEAMRRRSGDDH